MRKTILYSVVLTVFSLFTGCQANERNSQSENVNMTTETVTESGTVIMNSVDYHSVYDSYLFDTLIQTYGLSASAAENAAPDHLNIPHNELLGLVSAVVYDFGDDGASELLVLTRENAGDYCCNCYLTLYAYEQGAVVRKDRILLDEYVITSGGEHGDRFELGIYGDTIFQSLDTRRYASYGPDALCNEYTFIAVEDSTFSKLVLKTNALQVENKNYGEVIYHCEELCRNSMYGGCSDYSDKNDIEKAATCISDILSQKNFNCFDSIQLNDNQAIKLTFTKEPDVKICDYDRYAGFTTTDHTGFQEKALDAGYTTVTTESTEPSAESNTDTEPSTETYSAEMNVCRKKGEIRGVNVEGCIATFNEQIGDYSYTGTTLENQQQVVAVRSYRYKDRTWYDLYDIDYNVYYGWVDEKYIIFYDESTQTTVSETTTTTTETTVATTECTTTEPVAASWQDAYRIALSNIRNSDNYESAYMWDLADLDGDTVPELLISSGFDRIDKVSIYYYDGKQAVLLDTNSDGKGDKFGEGGYMGLDGGLMIESGYHNNGVFSYTYYRYHSDHSVERLKYFYTNEGFAKENGLAPDYKIDGEYVTPDFFYDIYYQMRPENYTRFTPVGRKYTFDDDSALE